ncbi:MAG: hypothetical protein HUJ26_09850 [Planctomycetaceae bacterium]|nr:hypothetical protein [Planctomycetaceae bacterium]
MIFPSLRTMLATAMLGVGFVPQLASAEEPGVVRISDGIQQTTASKLANVPAPLPEEVAGEVNGPKVPPAPIPEGGIILDENGQVVQHHHGHAIQDEYGKTWEPKTYATPLHVWFSQDPYAATLHPSYGFYAPTSNPRVFHQPVTYRRYLPNQFYGTPGMKYSEVQYPMVHTPTDTTQLGYTYQYVPQWMPNRANYPLAPNPVLWQRRIDPMHPYHAQTVNGMMQNIGAQEKDLAPTPIVEDSESDSEI